MIDKLLECPSVQPRGGFAMIECRKRAYTSCVHSHSAHDQSGPLISRHRRRGDRLRRPVVYSDLVWSLRRGV